METPFTTLTIFFFRGSVGVRELAFRMYGIYWLSRWVIFLMMFMFCLILLFANLKTMCFIFLSATCLMESVAVVMAGIYFATWKSPEQDLGDCGEIKGGWAGWGSGGGWDLLGHKHI